MWVKACHLVRSLSPGGNVDPWWTGLLSGALDTPSDSGPPKGSGSYWEGGALRKVCEDLPWGLRALWLQGVDGGRWEGDS